MRVRHSLPGVGTGVKDHPITALRQALIDRYLMRLRRHLVQQALARRGDRGEISEVHPRDYQHMHGRLGVDVTECNGAVTI